MLNFIILEKCIKNNLATLLTPHQFVLDEFETPLL